MTYKIRKFFQQLWCDHMFKVYAQEELSSGFRTRFGVGIFEWTNVALFSECVLCGKKKVHQSQMDHKVIE